MKNASRTFQRLTSHIVHGLQSCVIYIDEAVTYHDAWKEYVVRMPAFLERLASVK